MSSLESAVGAWTIAVLAVMAAALGCSRPPGVTPAQAAELLRQPGVYLLDVRTPEEYKAGHIEGAALIPLQELGGRLGELPAGKGAKILVYCAVGGRSAAAARELGAKGYEVRDLTGGLAAWERAGLPVKR